MRRQERRVATKRLRGAHRCSSQALLPALGKSENWHAQLSLGTEH